MGFNKFQRLGNTQVSSTQITDPVLVLKGAHKMVLSKPAILSLGLSITGEVEERDRVDITKADGHLWIGNCGAGGLGRLINNKGEFSSRVIHDILSTVGKGLNTEFAINKDESELEENVMWYRLDLTKEGQVPVQDEDAKSNSADDNVRDGGPYPDSNEADLEKPVKSKKADKEAVKA